VKLIEITPSEYRRGPAFVTRARGCGLEDVRMPVYGVSAEARGLSELRKLLGFGLHEAARKIGIKAIELSCLERGQLVPEGGRNDWMMMAERLRTP